MNKILLILCLFFLNCSAYAWPHKELFTVVKGDNVCVYTQDKNTFPEDKRIYLYMGEIHPNQAYQTSYSKLYTDKTPPIEKKDCIKINQSNFKYNIPYEVILDMERVYSTRICVNKNANAIYLTQATDGFNC